VSASAALTGLIFVAVSINLSRMLEFEALPRRVLKALFMLMYVPFVSSLALMPGQPIEALGMELLVCGATAIACTLVLDVGTWRMTLSEFRGKLIWVTALSLVVGVATLIAGVSTVAHAGGGLYWLVPAVLVAFVAARIEAWVLLIEIVR
jgi:modulator of FtsH protease